MAGYTSHEQLLQKSKWYGKVTKGYHTVVMIVPPGDVGLTTHQVARIMTASLGHLPMAESRLPHAEFVLEDDVVAGQKVRALIGRVKAWTGEQTDDTQPTPDPVVPLVEKPNVV